MADFDPRSFQEYLRFLNGELAKLEQALALIEKSQRYQLRDIRNQIGEIKIQTSSDLQKIQQCIAELRRFNSR